MWVSSWAKGTVCVCSLVCQPVAHWGRGCSSCGCAPVSEVPLSYRGHWSQTLVHGTLGSHRESIRGLVAVGSWTPAPFSSRAAYITVKPCLVRIKRFWKSISVKYHIKYLTGKKTTNLVKCSPFQPWTKWMQRTFLWPGYHFFQGSVGGWGRISLSWHPE